LEETLRRTSSGNSAWLAAPRNARLLRRGERVQVEPKALRFLEVLIEKNGELIDRDVLLHEVWGPVVG